MLGKKLKEKDYLSILKMQNGEEVTKENWPARRAELQALLEEYSYGKTPKAPRQVCGEVLSSSPKQGLIVKCKDGAVRLLEVQASGGKRIKGGDFINGRKAQKGDIFHVE